MAPGDDIKGDVGPLGPVTVQSILAALKAFTLYPNTRPLNVDLTLIDGRVTMGRPFEGPLTLGGPFLPDSTCPNCTAHIEKDFQICPECDEDLSRERGSVFKDRIKGILEKLARSFKDPGPKASECNVCLAC